ncbi:hypothetical protein NUW54_g10106 [Trametes sanguinea]|uniref:Uncharacterized protein n=1 Tax=Trametes sanguinea TaxID=158606 RepID=A0ACC1P4H4_9APHY|nr:hypothetical protein NUW54_g10106 [Trametes sanguinea]
MLTPSTAAIVRILPRDRQLKRNGDVLRMIDDPSPKAGCLRPSHNAPPTRNAPALQGEAPEPALQCTEHAVRPSPRRAERLMRFPGSILVGMLMP